jgi:hypothetical protein
MLNIRRKGEDFTNHRHCKNFTEYFVHYLFNYNIKYIMAFILNNISC